MLRVICWSLSPYKLKVDIYDQVIGTVQTVDFTILPQDAIVSSVTLKIPLLRLMRELMFLIRILMIGRALTKHVITTTMLLVCSVRNVEPINPEEIS